MLRQALRNHHVVAIGIACVLVDALLISIGVAGFGSLVEGRWALAWLIGFGARLLSGFFTSPRAWRYLDASLGTATLALAVGMAVG